MIEGHPLSFKVIFLISTSSCSKWANIILNWAYFRNKLTAGSGHFLKIAVALSFNSARKTFPIELDAPSRIVQRSNSIFMISLKIVPYRYLTDPLIWNNLQIILFYWLSFSTYHNWLFQRFHTWFSVVQWYIWPRVGFKIAISNFCDRFIQRNALYAFEFRSRSGFRKRYWEKNDGDYNKALHFWRLETEWHFWLFKCMKLQPMRSWFFQQYWNYDIFKLYLF